MSRWTLVIPEKTDRMVRTHLARTGGKKGDLSKLVDQAVVKEVLRQTVDAVRRENADLSAEETMKLANEAVSWARETRP